MATKLEGSIKRWIGLSSDRKPGTGVDAEGVTVLASDIPPGSSFLETDTGQIYRWTGTAWIAPTIDTRIVDLLTQILDEAYRERRIQEIALDLNSNDYVE
jgi:hypothetical protein